MSDTAAKVTEGRDFALVERVDHQGIVTHSSLALSLSLKVDPSLPFDHAVPILASRHVQGSTFDDVSHVASGGPRASGQEVNVIVDTVAPSTVDVLLFNGDRLWVVPVTLLGRGGQRTPTAPPFCYKLQKPHGEARRQEELTQSALAQHRTDHAERKKAKQAWREFGKYVCEAFTSYIEAEVDYSKNKNKKKVEAERLRANGSAALSHTIGTGSAEQVATSASLPEESSESVHDGPRNDASASAGHVVVATAPAPAAPSGPHRSGDTPAPVAHALAAGQLEVLPAPQRASGAPPRPSTPSATSQAEDALMSRMTIHASGAFDAESSVGGRAAPSSEGDASASASQPRSHRRPTHRDRMRIRKEGLARDAARREAAAALELALAALEPTGSEEGGSSAASQAGEVAPPDLPAPETLESGQGPATKHSSASSSASTDSKKKDKKIAQVAGLLRQAVQRAFNPEGGARGSQGGGSSRHSEGGAGPMDTLEQGTGGESPSGRMPVSAGGFWPRAGSSGGGAGSAGQGMQRSPFDSFGARAFGAKPRSSGPQGMFSSARSVSSSVQSGSMGGWGHVAAGAHSHGQRPTGSGYTPSYTSKRSGHEGSSVAPMWAPDHPHQAHMQHGGLLDGTMGAPMLAAQYAHYPGASPQGYHPQEYSAHPHGYPMQQQGMAYVPAGSLLAPAQGGYALPHSKGGVTAPPGYVMQQQSAPSHSNMTYLAVDNNTRQVHVLQGPGAGGVSPPSHGMAPVPHAMTHAHPRMPIGMQPMPMVQGSMMPQYQGVQPIGQQQPVFVHLMPSQ